MQTVGGTRSEILSYDNSNGSAICMQLVVTANTEQIIREKPGRKHLPVLWQCSICLTTDYSIPPENSMTNCMKQILKE